MPKYDVALVVTIEAPTYEKALEDACNMADGIADSDQVACSCVMNYDVDNENQRILYLSPVEPRLGEYK